LLKKKATVNRWRWTIPALGVLVYFIGVCLMIGGSILGERTVGIATLLGIEGCGIICMSVYHIIICK